MRVAREWIIAEIRRLADEAGGTAPGKSAFFRATGIKESDWSGHYWARWSDAIDEAGFSPNAMQTKLDDDALARSLANEVRRLGRFPTYAEMKLRRKTDRTFPSHNTVASRGDPTQLHQLVKRFCEKQDEYADVISLLPPIDTESSEPTIAAQQAPPEVATHGYVYLVRSGKHHKIGQSTDVQKRLLQLNTGMPESGTLVHVISTDDPRGIERYWHTRFADRRVRPDAEWFALSVADVTAFRRRQYM